MNIGFFFIVLLLISAFITTNGLENILYVLYIEALYLLEFIPNINSLFGDIRTFYTILYPLSLSLLTLEN